MGDSVIANALKRKTSVGQRAREVRGVTPTRAIRIALARAAGDLWELPLSVLSVRHDIIPSEALPSQFDDEAMMLLLDGPDGVRGGMAVDRALLTSVTEVQTIGEVSEHAPGDRPFTPTDAALFAPLVDAMMERVDLALNGPDHDEAACNRSEAAWVLGYRFGAKVDQKRSLVLALDGEEFHILRLEVDVAAGMRKGSLTICLPEAAVAEALPDPEPVLEPGTHADALAAVPTRLTATMPQLSLPLSKATSLQVGDLLPLGFDALQGIVLCSSDGHRVARCALGKIGDMRALRLLPRPGQAVPQVAPEAVEGFSTGLPSYAEPEMSVAPSNLPQETAPTPHAASTQSSDADPQPEAALDPGGDALPDLPPLDFDAPFDDGLPPLQQSVGNANFE